MIDETSDISCVEQVSLCFRFVKEDLTVHEEFVGFYEIKSTTSETSLKIVENVLTRFQLDINSMRGQCFN